MNIENQVPLRWPEGWERTRIQDRKSQAAWKKTFSQYREAVVKELKKMGAEEVLITYNPPGQDRMDCGVAVWFSKIRAENYEWQEALGIDTPAPTLEQIDDAYKRLAMKHHPDRGGDIEIFKKITEHRNNARAWVLGTLSHQHEFALGIDRFSESRLNLAAIRLTFAAFRQLERVGAPAVLERTFRGFKTALPAKGETTNVPVSS